VWASIIVASENGGMVKKHRGTVLKCLWFILRMSRKCWKEFDCCVKVSARWGKISINCRKLSQSILKVILDCFKCLWVVEKCWWVFSNIWRLAYEHLKLLQRVYKLHQKCKMWFWNVYKLSISCLKVVSKSKIVI
jgi:hypothetical protein